MPSDLAATHVKGRCGQPPDAENRTSGGLGGAGCNPRRPTRSSGCSSSSAFRRFGNKSIMDDSVPQLERRRFCC